MGLGTTELLVGNQACAVDGSIEALARSGSLFTSALPVASPLLVALVEGGVAGKGLSALSVLRACRLFPDRPPILYAMAGPRARGDKTIPFSPGLQLPATSASTTMPSMSSAELRHKIQNLLLGDLASFAYVKNLAGSIAGLTEKLEECFRRGDIIQPIQEGKYQRVNGRVQARSVTIGNSLVDRSVYETFLAWKETTGFPTSGVISAGSPEFVALRDFAAPFGIVITLEEGGDVLAADVLYVHALLEKLPSQFLNSGFVKGIQLGGEGNEAYEGVSVLPSKRDDVVRLHKGLLNGERKTLLGVLIYEMCFSTAKRFSRNAEMNRIVRDWMPVSPDASIPIDIREALHRHFQSLPVYTFDWTNGRKLVTEEGFDPGMVSPFLLWMATLLTASFLNGRGLREYIASLPESTRVPYAFIYQELRRWVFDGAKYDFLPPSPVQSCAIRLGVGVNPVNLFSMPDDREAVVFGRLEESDIILVEGRASRRHAAIRRVDNEFVIEDLGSSYGTWLQKKGSAKKRCLKKEDGPVVLERGDTVTMGSMTFVFSLLQD